MRLLNTTTLELEEIIGDRPAYAILSHRWQDDEVSFQDAIKGKAIALEKDRDVALKMHEQDKKQVDELAREREILNKNLLKAAAATTQQLDAVRLHEQNKKNLEQEVSLSLSTSNFGCQRKNFVLMFLNS